MHCFRIVAGGVFRFWQIGMFRYCLPLMSNFALVVEVAGAHRNFTAFLTLIYEKKRCFFRIALSCTQEDSAAILSIGNDAAAELQIPPEAILNNSNGMKSANIRFSVPFAEPEYRQNLLEQLNLCAKKRKSGIAKYSLSGRYSPKSSEFGRIQNCMRQIGT